MIKKQNLWFLTLFSVILVLGVYYVTMPNEVFTTNNNVENNENPVVDVTENEYLVSLEVELEEERQTKKTSLEEILNNSEASTEDKNSAYLELKYLNEIKGQEELLEAKINKNFSVESFVKIENEDISVVVIKEDHDISLANQIMNAIQEEYKNPVVIAVKFEK